MNTLTSIVHSVRDLAAAKAIHVALLGTEPHTDTPYYVGFHVGGVEFGLTPNDGTAAPSVAYVGVADIDGAVAELVAAGATVVTAPHEVGGGTRIATVADPGGIILGVITGS